MKKKTQNFGQKFDNIEHNKMTMMKNTKLSAMKNFNFKTIKRENIDKQILRKFRKFIKTMYSSPYLVNMNSISCEPFWEKFVIKNFLPPVQYDEFTEFKSFNTKYMIWIFTQEGFRPKFEEWVEANYNEILAKIIETVNLIDPTDKEMLENYLKVIAQIYSEFEQEDNEQLSKTNNFNENQKGNFFQLKQTKQTKEDEIVENLSISHSKTKTEIWPLSKPNESTIMSKCNEQSQIDEQITSILFPEKYDQFLTGLEKGNDFGMFSQEQDLGMFNLNNMSNMTNTFSQFTMTPMSDPTLNSMQSMQMESQQDYVCELFNEYDVSMVLDD